MKYLIKISAVVLFLIAIQSSSTCQSGREWLNIGQAHLDQNKLDSAKLSFTNAYKSDSITHKTIATRGLLKVAIWASDMEAGGELISIGDSLTELQEFDQAVFLYELAKAGFYKKSSEYQKALDIFKKVMPLGKDLPKIDYIYAAGLQSYGLVYEKFSKYDSSVVFMEIAHEIFINIPDTTSSKYGMLCNNMGSTYLYLSDLTKAKRFFEKSLSTFSNLANPVADNISMVQGNLAIVYSREGDYKASIKMTEEALKIHRSIGDKNAMAYNYYSLGIDYYYLGDYGRTKDYIQQCIQIRKEIYGPNHSSLIGPYEVTAMAIQESGDYKGGMQYYLTAQKIIKHNFKTPGEREGNNLENIASSFRQIGKQDSALAYILRANKILDKIHPKISYHRAVHYMSLGNIYVSNGQIDKGKTWLSKALAIMEQLELQEDLTNALIKINIATLEANRNNWEEADKEFQEALTIIGIDEHTDSEILSVSPEALEVFHSYMTYLYKKYEEFSDEKYLIQYQEISTLYLSISERLRRQFNDPYTKSTLVKNSIPIFRTQIGIYAKLYFKTLQQRYLDNLFAHAEYSRATMLRDMQDEKIASYARVDKGTIDKENNLKKSLAEANASYFEYPDSLAIKNSLFEAKEALNQFVSNASTQNPNYFELKYGGDSPTITEIQQQLKDDQVLLEYMIDDTAYYALYLTKNKSGLNYLGNRDSINEYIELYHNQIIANKTLEVSISNYLYDHLWLPIPPLKDHSRVIICPVSSMYYLNLETLKSRDSDEYLITTHNISYTLSANIFINKSQNNKRTNSLAIAIAPGFEDEHKNLYQSSLDTTHNIDNEYMLTLRQPWSVRLAEKLKVEYKNKAFIGTKANESIVKSSLSQGNIIYFGTHAITNEHDPLRSKLVLSKSIGTEGEDGYLHAYEIYGLDINADLTILSACESGIGQIEEGEGMISLAHSIHYAGCPSTMLSLWKVDEKSNTKLIEQFIENIAKGQVKSEALRSAKLNFIENSGHSHPYFWAGMILMGQDGTVALVKQSYFKWYLVFGLVALLLMFYLFRRIKS